MMSGALCLSSLSAAQEKRSTAPRAEFGVSMSMDRSDGLSPCACSARVSPSSDEAGRRGLQEAMGTRAARWLWAGTLWIKTVCGTVGQARCGPRRPFGNAHRGVGFRRGGLSASGLLTRVLVGFLRRSAHALTEPRRSACDGPCGRRWPAASLLTFPCIPSCSRVPSCSLLRGAAVRRRCS